MRPEPPTIPSSQSASALNPKEHLIQSGESTQAPRQGATFNVNLTVIVATLVTLAAILWLYREAAEDIVSIWYRSQTFAHGFLVPPIVLWLAWRDRERLAAVASKPSLAALALLIPIGLLWLLSELAGVAVGTHFALALMLIAAVIAVAGVAVARVIAFPLVFLLLAVPAGEFFVPWLIDRTADFTVLALRLSGIPVYREASNFIIPSGAWSVVEACSGIRYLIASIFGGTLFAYLYCRTWGRRCAIVLTSILVPLVANWIRAYLIVLIGHLSSNRLATGVDHLIYGWIFFGVMMFIFFAIAARWRQDQDEPVLVAKPVLAGATSSAATARVLVVAILTLVLAGAWLPAREWLESRASPGTVKLELSAGEAGWTKVADSGIDWRPIFQNPTATVFQPYRNGDNLVGVYIAYYRQQKHGAELVSSENAMVLSDDKEWRVIEFGHRDFQWAGTPTNARTLSLRGTSQQLRIRNWYWIDGRHTSSDFVAKLLLAWTKLTGAGDNSAALVLVAPFTDGSDAADRALDQFANDMGNSMRSSLERAVTR